MQKSWWWIRANSNMLGKRGWTALLLMGNTFVNQFRIHIIFLMVSIVIFNYTLHIFPLLTICRVGLYTELLIFMLSSLPCFPAFCLSVIPTSFYFSIFFFNLVYVTFFSTGACMSWSLPSVSQSSKSVLIGFLSRCIANEAIVLQSLVETALWDSEVVKKRWASALLSVKCCCFVRNHREGVTQFWTSPSEEDKEETFCIHILCVHTIPTYRVYDSILIHLYKSTCRQYPSEFPLPTQFNILPIKHLASKLWCNSLFN